MKLLGNFTGKLLACVTAFALASFLAEAQAQTMHEGSAQVRAIRGSAKYSLGGGVWVPLTKGKTLKEGAIIQTAAESIVDLNLGPNGPVVRVTPNTVVALDKLAHGGTGADSVIETRLDLKSGTVLGNVKKLAKASKYEIRTPNGVAGIRGTDYVVTAVKKDANIYLVTFTSVEGTVVVAADVNGSPQTVVLNTGESWTPGSDVAPTSAQLLEFYKDQVALAINNAAGTPTAQASIPPVVHPVTELFRSPTIGAEAAGD